MLSEHFDQRAEFINASANGRTTRQALEAMPYEVQSHRPDIVIVQFGLNDANRWATDMGLPRVSPLAFQANLTEIYQRAYAAGAKTIFAMTNHVVLRINDYNWRIREAVAVGEDIDLPIHLIDMAEALKSQARYLLPDGVHLNDVGHRLYFEATRHALDKVIP